MAHIFDCSSDDRISGAIRIDTCAGAVTDSGIGVILPKDLLEEQQHELGKSHRRYSCVVV
jgi:hypothetical protein